MEVSAEDLADIFAEAQGRWTYTPAYTVRKTIVGPLARRHNIRYKLVTWVFLPIVRECEGPKLDKYWPTEKAQ